MLALLLASAALWKCSAIDPRTGILYYAQAATAARAGALAVNFCEMAEPFGPPTTCFVYRCVQIGGDPAPQPSPCTCNPERTQCTCEVDPVHP